MKLTRELRTQFRDALVNAFEDYTDLEMMLDEHLGKNLRAIVREDDLEVVAYNLVKRAEREGWIRELLSAARSANPANPSLLAFEELVKAQGLLDQPDPTSVAKLEKPNPGSCWRTFPPKRQCWKQHSLIVVGVLVLVIAAVVIASLLDDGTTWTEREHNFGTSDTFAPISAVVDGSDVRYFADYRDEQWAMWSPDNFGDGSIESPDPGAPVRDSIIAVDARVLQNKGVYVAIACRYSEIIINGKARTQRYQLSVDPWAGQFRLQRRVGETVDDLVPWTEDDSIKREQELNRIELECRGDRISASINGESVANVTDDQLPAGNACLIASRRGNETPAPLEVRFDNLEIRIPS